MVCHGEMHLLDKTMFSVRVYMCPYVCVCVCFVCVYGVSVSVGRSLNSPELKRDCVWPLHGPAPADGPCP